MHTDTDNEITALIADRAKLEADLAPGMNGVRAEEIAQLITGINLQIMRLQGKQAHQPQQEATKAAIANLRNAYLGDPDSAPKCPGISNGLADLFAGIEERIVWTTKDGKRWDRLEDAIRHQQIEKIIDAMVACGDLRISCIARQVAENAAEIFAILEPFFRKGE